VHLYELALEEGETSRDMVVRAQGLGLGHLMATSELTPDEIRALCPHRAGGSGPGGPIGPPPGAHPGAPAPAPTSAPTAAAPSRPAASPSPFEPYGPLPEPTGRRRPPRVVVAVAALVGLIALAGGAVTFLGTSGDEPEAAATTEPGADTSAGAGEAFTAITDPPGPRGPVAGSRSGQPVEIVEVEPLCGGWPFVSEYVVEHADRLAVATTPEEVTRWAADAHRAPLAGMERVNRSFGVNGPSEEAMNVWSWIIDTHTDARDWDLDTMRRGSEHVGGAVMVMQAAYDEAC
jgi:hypothetical protein